MRLSEQKKYWLCHVSGIALLALSGANAYAVPEGGVVVGGDATITQQPYYTEIQQRTERAAINWKQFDIPADHHTHFVQPSRNSVTLNRVTGSQHPSQIMGKLTANGTVALVNPNGVVFGKEAQVDVGGIIASTANIRNEDFMAGRDYYTIPGNPNATIENQGSITVKDAGLAAFVAPNVRNSGTITAHVGKVEMSSADSFAVDLYGDGLYKLAISDDHAQRLLEQNGKIDAKGGYVRMSAAQAKNLVDSTLKVSGTIDVSHPNGKGGTVELSADKVKIAHTARIHADGTKGGGTVLAGGDFQGGNNPEIRLATKKIENATATTVDAGAVITANAITDGKGGTVVVWADEKTAYQGTIEAKGGKQGGDGGFIEVSGKQTLEYQGKSNTSAPKGKSGTLLLDPTDIVIATSGGNITPATIVNDVQNNGEVIIHTNYGTGGTGHITVNSSINYTSSNALTLLAQGNLNINRSIQNGGSGNINLVAGWNGTTGYNVSWTNPLNVAASFNIQDIVTNPAAYGQNSGDVLVGNGTQTSDIGVGSRYGKITVAGRDIIVRGNNDGTTNQGRAFIGVQNSGGILNNDVIDIYAGRDISVLAGKRGASFAQIGLCVFNTSGACNGNISLTAVRDINVRGGINTTPSNAYAMIGHGSYNTDNTSYSGNITVNAGGSVNLIAGSQDNASAKIGHVQHYQTNMGNVTGNINITAQHLNLEAAAADKTFGSASVAQIGHGSDSSGGAAGSSFEGDITINTTGNISVKGGAYNDGYARIGHGGLNDTSPNTANYRGNISVNATGNITLQSSAGADSSAAIGHGANDGTNSAAITGNISIVNQGNITMISGSGDDALTHIGHGGYDYKGNATGNITINTNGLSLNGGSNSQTVSQIGHGVAKNNIGNSSGNITIINNGALNLQGGTAFESYAQIGHGSDGANSNRNGNISVTGNTTIIAKAGSGEDSYAQIGHGGNNSTGANSGDITVATSSTISLQGGSNAQSNHVIIGHGGNAANGVQSGNITVNAAGISLLAGSDYRTSAKIGHGGGENTLGNQSGDISITNNGNLVLQGGSTDESYAQIGHGSDGHNGNLSGNITILGNNVITLQGGSALDTYATIGHGGDNAVSSQSGNIAVNASSINMLAGSNGRTSAKIGHGGPDDTEGNLSGNINVTNSGALLMQGGIGIESHAQIGHGSDKSSTTTFEDNSGNISITSNSLTMVSGGTNDDTYVMIGHGGENANGNHSGNITVDINDDILMQSQSGNNDKFVLIGHGGLNGNNNNNIGTRQGHISVKSGNEISMFRNGDNPVYIGHYTNNIADISNANTFISADYINFNGVSGTSFILNNSNFASNMLTNLRRGNVTIASTDASVSVSGNNWLSNNTAIGNLTFLSRKDITFLRSAQHYGAGQVNAIAGWDGNTGLITNADFDIARLMDSTATGYVANAYGNSFGGATGSVNINTASNTNAVGVGSFAGTTNILGNDISLAGGMNTYSTAVIGYNDHGNATGNINVWANSDVQIAGHNTALALAQIGHGGQGRTGNYTGNIDVKAMNISLTGSPNALYDSSARIGHGGDNNNYQNYSGNININATNALTLTSGSGENLTQIGHGGTGSPMGGTRSGNITVNATGITLNGGTSYASPSLIGHGGGNYSNWYQLDGNIQVRGTNLMLNAGTGSNDAFAKIGHAVNDWSPTADITGNIDVRMTGNSTLTSSNIATAGIGHGVPGNWGNRQGHIYFSTGGELSLIEGTEPVIIGHSTDSGTLSNANIYLSAGSLDFSAAPASGSYVINNTRFRDRMITNLAGGDVTLASTNAPLVIDTAFTANSANSLNFLSTGNININQDITLTGGGKLAAFAGWSNGSGFNAATAQTDFSILSLANSNSGSLTINAALDSDGADANMFLASDDRLTVTSNGSLNSNTGFYHFFVQDGARTDIGSTAIDEEIELTPYNLGVSNANNTKQMVFYRLQKNAPPPSAPASLPPASLVEAVAPIVTVTPQPITAPIPVTVIDNTPQQPENTLTETVLVNKVIQQVVAPRAAIWENIFTSFDAPPQFNNPFISLGSIAPKLETQLLSYEAEYNVPNRHPKKSLARRIMELPQHLWGRRINVQFFKQ